MKEREQSHEEYDRLLLPRPLETQNSIYDDDDDYDYGFDCHRSKTRS